MPKEKLYKKLQSDPIFIPFNNGFDYQYVKTYIQDNKEKINDINLIIKALSTVFFNQYFIELKDNFNKVVGRKSLSKDDIVDIMINFSNRDFYLLKVKTDDFISQKENYHIDEIANLSIESDFKELGSFNAQGVIEAKHDALNIILNLLLNQNFYSDGIKVDNEQLSDLYNLLGYASLYTVIKFAYDTAIWEGYDIVLLSKQNELKIKSHDPESSKIKRVGEQRLEKNITSSKIVVRSKYSEEGDFFRILSKQMKSKRKPKRLKSVFLINNYLHYKLADGFDDASISYELMTFAELTTYYQFLGNEVLPNFENLSLHDLITVFSEIQNLLSSSFNLKKVESKDIAYTLDLYKIYIQKNHLVDYLFAKLNYSKKQINIVVKLLSHEQGNYNIWEKPLIHRNDDLIPVFLPALSPNTLRLIDYWLEQGGFDLDIRGKLFENHIKKIIKAELNRKGFFVNIPRTNYFKNNKNEREEIDLIIELKTTIVVSEVKCIKFPFDPRDFHNMYKRLLDGAIQAKRKTKFIKDNISEFKEVFINSSKEIISLVITNFPIYSGSIIENIPVIDFSLLENYFLSGSLNKSPIGFDGKKLYKNDNPVSIIYYTDDDQFSNNLRSFILDPIPVRELKPKVYLSEKQLSLPEAHPKIVMDYAMIKDSEII